MLSRAFVAAAVGFLAGCAPGALSSGTDESDTGEPELPSTCIESDAEPLCTWTALEQPVTWASSPVNPFSLTGPGCVHGLVPKLAFDGDSLLVAYTDDLCVQGNRHEQPPEYRLVIGTDTLGEWQTELTSRDPWPEHIDIAPDGTVRVMTQWSVLERRDGLWTRWTPSNNGSAWVLSDPTSGPDHVLFRTRAYGRSQDHVSALEVIFECQEHGLRIHSPYSAADFVISSVGAPHLAYYGATSAVEEIGLLHSYLRDGEWVIEKIACSSDLDHLFRGPELEVDADGHAHVCATIDAEPDNVVFHYFTNESGAWTSEIAAQASSTGCELEIDATGRVHLLTSIEYRVLDDGTWSTVRSFDEPASADLQVHPGGAVYILRSGLELLTDESGEWVERQIGIGYVP